MERYILKNDIKTFGVKVKNFPNGIGEAFERLVKMFPEEDKRPYYGISQMAKNGNMEYYATTEEVDADEAEKYKCNRYTIEKGEYLVEPPHDWLRKTDCIKNVFQSLIQDASVDKKKPSVEWYKNEKEMLCMVKTVQLK